MIRSNPQSGLFKYKFNESGCNQHQANLLFNEGLMSFNCEGKEALIIRTKQ